MKELHLDTRKDIANWLGISQKQLIYVLYVRKPESYYRSFEIAKKNGGKRIINAPTKELYRIQKILTFKLEEIYAPRKCVYGFVKGRSILDNARCHTKKEFCLNIDLKDFFTQFNFGRIRGLFLKEPYKFGTEAATIIAQIVCYKGVLPQGASTSPIITNMICRSFDFKMINLCGKYKSYYSRYADDIVISTRLKEFPIQLAKNNQGIIELSEELTSVFEEAGLVINYEKVYLNASSYRQEVTGLTVNVIPNVPRRYLKELRALFFRVEKDGIKRTIFWYYRDEIIDSDKISESEYEKLYKKFFQVLCGKVGYIGQIRGLDNGYYQMYAKKINSIYDSRTRKYPLVQLEDKLQEACLVIKYDGEDICYQGSGFLLKNYGLVTAAHVMEKCPDKFFSVLQISQYDTICQKKIEEKGRVSVEDDDTYWGEKIDALIFGTPARLKNNDHWPLSKNKKITVGMRVIIIGFPNWSEASSAEVQMARVTGNSHYMGATLYTVDVVIRHGASGGVVLDERQEVLGIIKGGVSEIELNKIQENSLGKDDEISMSGFLSIYDVINDYNSYFEI